MVSKKSFIYWTIFFILGIYITLYDLNYFIGGFVFFVMFFIYAHFFTPRLAYYALFSLTFYFLGGLTIYNDLSTRSVIFSGHRTYLGKVIEINQKESWSNLKIELIGSYSRMQEAIRMDVTGENVMLILPSRHLEKLDYLDEIVFSSTFEPIINPNNPGEFNAENYFLSKNIMYSGFLGADSITIVPRGKKWSFKSKLKSISNWSSNVIEKTVGGGEAAVIIGMLLGDQSSIDWEIKQAFINTGSSHMLAVSGAHIAVITALLIGLIDRIGISTKGWTAAVFLLTFLWSYAFLTGFSASVVRSVLMFSCLVIFRFVNRSSNNIHVLSISALFIIAFNWNSALDVGFQLSYAAMLGIFIVNPILLRLWAPKNKAVKWIWDGTALCLAAQVFTTPLALYHFHQFPNYFVLSNFLVMLASGPLLIGGMMLLAFSWVPILKTLIATFLSWSGYLFISGLKLVDTLPWSVAYGYSLTILEMCIALFLIVYMLNSKNKYKWVIGSILFMTVISFQRWVNYDKKGLMLFNAPNITLAYLEKGKSIIFTSDYENAVKKGIKLGSDFNKIFPSQIEYKVLPKKGQEVWMNNGLRIVGEDGFLILYYNQTLYYLIYNSGKFLIHKDELEDGLVVSFEKIESIEKALIIKEKAIWFD